MMKNLIVILSMLIVLLMIPAGTNGAEIAADETVFIDSYFTLAPGQTWFYYNEETVYESGLRFYGNILLDQNIHFFISDPEGYAIWLENDSSVMTLYDFPSVSELDIFYRHAKNCTLYFLIYNPITNIAVNGSIFVNIDRTGPIISHNIIESDYHAGIVDLSFAFRDDIFRMQNASLIILNETLWYRTYTVLMSVPQITGVYALNTKATKYEAYEDTFVYIYLIGTDEGNNTSTMELYFYIDNYVVGTIPHGGTFTWFGVMLFAGFAVAIVLSMGVIKWQYDKWKNPHKLEEKAIRELEKRKLEKQKGKGQ